ncbi:unnamed protein product, partial [Candidula unifasciata]
ATRFEVSLKCPNESTSQLSYYTFLTLTEVKLKSAYNASSNETIWLPTGSDGSKGVIEALCPSNEDLVYSVIENMDPGVIDVFGDHRLASDFVELMISESDEYLNLNATSGELLQQKSYDRETKELHKLKLLCIVKVEGQPDVITPRTLKLQVVDVNDNPPFTNMAHPTQVSNYTAGT